jgi:DNA recombination-dependent growth factor C
MLDAAAKFIADNGAILGTVLGVLFFMVKAVSNKKADPIMAKIQNAADKLPAMIDKVGDFLKAVCSIVSKALKSDGFFGSK